MNKGELHEGFAQHTAEKQASDKSLGQVFAGVFALIASARFYHGRPDAIGWLAAAGVFLLLAYFWQAPLKPINWFWSKLGTALFAITNPVIMGIVFFVAVMPTGLLMRAFGKDPLRMKMDKEAASYWIIRQPAGPSGQEMKNQF